MPPRLPLQFAAGLLEDHLAARTDTEDGELTARLASQTAQRDLERYYQLLADELARVTLSEDEASVLITALHGTIHGPHDYRYLWTGVEDHLAYARADRADDEAAAVTLSADELQERELAQAWGDRVLGPGPGQDAAAARIGAQGASVLVAKLRALTPGQTLAILDAVERYYQAEGGHIQRLHRVGLVRA